MWIYGYLATSRSTTRAAQHSTHTGTRTSTRTSNATRSTPIRRRTHTRKDTDKWRTERYYMCYVI